MAILFTYSHIFVQDFHLNQLEFEIPITSVSLAQVFGRLETEKSMLHIQEYSVSQPTLEQVQYHHNYLAPYKQALCIIQTYFMAPMLNKTMQVNSKCTLSKLLDNPNFS